MRIFHAVTAITVVIATQVTNTVAHMPVTAQLLAQRAEAAATPVHTISFNTNTTQPLQVVDTRASFDEAVVQPLKAAQTAKASAEAAAAKARATYVAARAKVTVSSGDVWEQLRLCEAGGDYTRNSGNGYYGAYQYNLGTWAGYGGYARPDLAPPAVQDAKAHATQAARGWSPWPACARKLGLL